MTSLFDSIIVNIGCIDRGLGKLLGKGTFGKVYLLRDIYLPDAEKHRKCAVKIMQITAESSEYINANTFAYHCMRVLGEARSQELFSMIGLAPQVHGVKICENHSVMIMDMVPVEYTPFTTILKSRNGTLIIRAFNTIIKTVEFLHASGLQHGDLNPGNIFYNENTDEVMFIDISMQVKGRPNIYDWGTLYYYIDVLPDCNDQTREVMINKLNDLGAMDIPADIWDNNRMFPHMDCYRFDIGLHSSIEIELCGQKSVSLSLSNIDHSILIRNRNKYIQTTQLSPLFYKQGIYPFDGYFYFIALHIFERLPEKLSNNHFFAGMMIAVLLYLGIDGSITAYDKHEHIVYAYTQLRRAWPNYEWDKLQFELLSAINFQIMNMWEIHIFDEYITSITDDSIADAAIRALIAISQLPEYLTNSPEIMVNIVAYHLNTSADYVAMHNVSADVVKHKYSAIEAELTAKIDAFNQIIEVVAWRDRLNSS